MTGGFFFFLSFCFCWFQAFFCLSGDETNIAPPSARHTCTRSRCCVRGLGELGSHTRDGARRSPATPAPESCPEEASVGDGGAYPARHTRAHPGGAAAGSPAAQGAARRARSCSQRDRPHPPGLVLRIRWVPRGADTEATSCAWGGGVSQRGALLLRPTPTMVLAFCPGSVPPCTASLHLSNLPDQGLLGGCGPGAPPSLGVRVSGSGWAVQGRESRDHQY